MPLNNTPTVAVYMITFNHQDYIAQAVESVMMQQTDFDVHLFIGEDFSSDNTRVICQSLKQKYPDRISLVLNERNLGANKNANNIYEACFKSGAKYIAMLEGDDYWTDPLKLQKQVDFMEGNLEYSGIGTNSEVIYEIDNTKHLYDKSEDNTFELNDLLEARKFHTATFLFRTKVFKEGFPIDVLSGDRILFMLIACFGKIKLISDITAVYRKSDGGISRTVSSKQLKKDFKIAKYISKYNTNFDYYKLQSFVAYTVFQYATKISLKDYIINSYLLLYYRLRSKNKKSRKAIISNTLKFIRQAMVKLKGLK